MGKTSERSGLLRILLADEDDANAFLFQCGINRLDRPCAFQRVGQPALLSEKIASFRPDILIAAGTFARPDQLKQIKQFANGHPIISAVETFADGEAALEAGAADCVLKSQVDELHACIEWHLGGDGKGPYFKRDLGRKDEIEPTKGPGKLELKLAEIDRRIGALLRTFAIATNLKARKLAHVSAVAAGAAAREVRRRYRETKVRWLMHRQKKLVQSNIVEASAAPHPFPPLPPRETETKPVDRIRIVSTPRKSSPLSASPAQAEAFDADTLRTLELSFKTLFHTSLDPVFLLDGIGSFLHANAPACALLGLAPADLLGKTLLEFVPLADHGQVSALWEALLIEGQQKSEVHLQTASGETRDVFISARSNLWFGIHLLVARDQTEIKNLRAALRNQSIPPGVTTLPPAPSVLGSHPAAPMPAP